MMNHPYPGLLGKIRAIPAMDAHTHIDTRHPLARGLHDVMLYHMVISELYAAGCPDAARLPEEPTEAEAAARIERALPYLPRIVNTSGYYLLRIMLQELFDWTEPLTLDNWKQADARIHEYSARPGRMEEVMQKANIRQFNTEYDRRGDGSLDHLFNYSQEWAFFTRTQWGRYDTALIELEHAWNHDAPCAPLPVTLTPDLINFAKKVTSVADVHAALIHYLDRTPYDEIVSIASGLSSDIDYRRVTDAEMTAALAKRGIAGPEEQNVYASYIFYAYLDAYQARGHKPALTFSLAAEPLPFESGNMLRAETGLQFARIIAEHPGIHFSLHIADMAHNQSYCSMARELPNLSVNGYWWHNFYPSFIPRVLSERLDMLPVNKIIGYFSDAYCMEWAYAKQRYVRHFTAQVLGERVALGQYDEVTAVSIAKWLMHDSVCECFDIKG